jgi:hypothetical protein
VRKQRDFASWRLLFSDDDYRDDVGFLGSLPLPLRPQSKPVTPWILRVQTVKDNASAPAGHSGSGPAAQHGWSLTVQAVGVGGGEPLTSRPKVTDPPAGTVEL